MKRKSPMPVLGLGVLVAVLVLLTAVPAWGVAPAGKHYAGTVVIGDPDNGEIDAAPACLSFTRNEVCTESNDCGTWSFVEKKGRHNTWTLFLEFEDEEDGEPVTVRAEGIGRTERRGPGSSIAATFVATLNGTQLNAAFAGVRTTRSLCLEFGLSDD